MAGQKVQDGHLPQIRKGPSAYPASITTTTASIHSDN